MDKSNNISVKSDSIIKGHMQPKVSIQALFIQNLNFIPNILTIENIDIDKCKNFIEKNFAEKIKSESEKKLYNPDNRKFEILEDLYILEDNIYIFLSCDVYSPQYNFLRIYYTATEKGQALEYGN